MLVSRRRKITKRYCISYSTCFFAPSARCCRTDHATIRRFVTSSVVSLEEGPLQVATLRVTGYPKLWGKRVYIPVRTILNRVSVHYSVTPAFGCVRIGALDKCFFIAVNACWPYVDQTKAVLFLVKLCSGLSTFRSPKPNACSGYTVRGNFLYLAFSSVWSFLNCLDFLWVTLRGQDDVQ